MLGTTASGTPRSSSPTASAATGRSATRTACPARTAHCTSTPRKNGCRWDFPIPEHLFRRSRTTARSRPTSTLRRRLRPAGRHRVQQRRAACARRPDGGWEITDQRGETREFDLLVVGNGHHWDARYPDFPGEFHRRDHPSRTTTSTADPLDLTGKRILVVGIGNSAADITVELSSKTLQNTVTLSTRSSAWIVPLHRRPARRHRVEDIAVPPAVLAAQGHSADGPVHGRRSPLYGLPEPNHKLFEGIRRSRWTCAAPGLRRRHPQAQRRPTGRQHRSFRGRHQRRVRRHRLRHRLQHHLPVLRPRFRQRPGNDIRLYKRMFSPASTIWCSSASPRPSRLCSPSSSVRPNADGRLRDRPYALPPVAEMERVIDADHQKYVGHCVDRPRHTQQVDYIPLRARHPHRELPAGVKRAELRAAALRKPYDALRHRLRFGRSNLQRLALPGEGDGYEQRPVGGGDGPRLGAPGLRSRTVRAATPAKQALTCWPSTTAASVPRKANRGERFRWSGRSTTSNPRSPPPNDCQCRPEPDRAVGFIDVGWARAAGGLGSRRHRHQQQPPSSR